MIVSGAFQRKCTGEALLKGRCKRSTGIASLQRAKPASGGGPKSRTKGRGKKINQTMAVGNKAISLPIVGPAPGRQACQVPGGATGTASARRDWKRGPCAGGLRTGPRSWPSAEWVDPALASADGLSQVWPDDPEMAGQMTKIQSSKEVKPVLGENVAVAPR